MFSHFFLYYYSKHCSANKLLLDERRLLLHVIAEQHLAELCLLFPLVWYILD